MSADLILHWPLDDLPSGSALDTGGNRLHGTVVGEPVVTHDARFGSCLTFSGTADELTLADSPALRVTTYTAQAWVSRTGTGTIVGTTGGFSLTVDATGALRHTVLRGTGTPIVHATAAGALPADGWYHVAITNDGAMLRTYVDGEPVPGLATAVAPGSGAATLTVASGLAGALAHVRLYDGALDGWEIRRDRSADESALAAFTRANPVGFALLNADDQPVLHIEDTPAGQTLTLRVTNSSRSAVSSVAGTDHLTLRLRPGTLDAAAVPRLDTPGWTLTTSDDLTTLTLRADAPVTIAAGGALDLLLSGLGAGAAGGSRGTRVELAYRNLRYGRQPEELTGVRHTLLEIINWRGRPDLPLELGFIGGDRLLSDGVTAGVLRLRLSNVSDATTVVLSGRDTADDAASALVLSFAVQHTTPVPWALTEAAKATGVDLTTPNRTGWNVRRDELGDRLQWTVSPRATETLAPGTSVELLLEDVVGLALPGHAPVLVALRNIPGYQDATRTAVVDRSPLLFTASRAGLGTRSPAAPLHILAPATNANGGALIIGSTNGSNLRLGQHDDHSWVQSHGGKPLVLNPLGNAVGVGAVPSPAPTARLTVTAVADHLQLRREGGSGEGGKVLFLELFQQAVTGGDRATYPVLRFHHEGAFWHRIEARPDGFHLKNGDLSSDAPTGLFAGLIGGQRLRLGGTEIGEAELRILKKLAEGALDVDLYNIYQQEYAYAANFSPFDESRRYVFTNRNKDTRATQGRWQLRFPT